MGDTPHPFLKQQNISMKLLILSVLVLVCAVDSKPNPGLYLVHTADEGLRRPISIHFPDYSNRRHRQPSIKVQSGPAEGSDYGMLSTLANIAGNIMGMFGGGGGGGGGG